MEVIYPAGERGQMSKSVQANLNGEFAPEMQQMLAAVEPPINPQSPIDTIGASAALIMAFLAGSAGQQGKPLDEGIMLNAGLDVVEVLANDGEQAGMFEVSEKDIEHAFYRGCDIYRYIGPNVDQQALAAEFEQIAAADRAGQLDKVIPGASRMQQAA